MTTEISVMYGSEKIKRLKTVREHGTLIKCWVYVVPASQQIAVKQHPDMTVKLLS